MATLDFPTLSRDGPSELSEWCIEPNTFVHDSIYTKQEDTLEMPFPCWSFVAVWRNLGLSDRSIFEAWFAKLAGRAGRFYFSHPMYRVPRGTARGTGTTGSAAQFSQSITLSGLTNGTTLLAGDFVEIGTALLVRLTDDAPTVSGGSTTIAFAPKLRLAVASSTAFSLVAPRAQFRFTDDKQSMPVVAGPGGNGLGDFTLGAIESF